MLFGLAQPIIEFVFWAHMIKPVYVVKQFNLLAAITLILLTAVTGYVFGSIRAVIWNKGDGRNRGTRR